jgi:hypothetical protein
MADAPSTAVANAIAAVLRQNSRRVIGKGNSVTLEKSGFR